MDFIKEEIVYNLDGNTQLEFLNRKTVVVIDKDRFLMCKQLYLENAPDSEFAIYLHIPEDKVAYFKYKMHLFEDSIRERKAAVKVEKEKKRAQKAKSGKREISAEERFRRARELISRNLPTNQISKILRVSERSVTRFKRRMREEKKRLKAEGKIEHDPNDPDDENSFKHLPSDQKLKRVKELFRRRLKIQDVSEVLKISERSVRRWKDRLTKGNLPEADVELIDNEFIELKKPSPVKRPARMTKMKVESDFDHEYETEHESAPAPKKRRLYFEREKVQYAKELIENKLSNKDMAMLLEMSIACVRKLKLKILDGTADELIDDSEEHYTKLAKAETNDSDPLNGVESYYASLPSTSTGKFERRTKLVLSERDMYMARLLRENDVRTMDIAKMMGISERSVTRLLARSKDFERLVYNEDLVAEVDQLIAEKDKILNPESMFKAVVGTKSGGTKSASEESKQQLGLNLLSMKVQPKDIAKMLDVCEKTVQRWKSKMPRNVTIIEEQNEDETSQSVYEDLIEEKPEDDDELQEDEMIEDDVIYEDYEEFE